MSDAGRYRVVFRIEGVGEAKGELIRIKAPLTAENVWKAIPITGIASIWKNAEVYFPAGIKRGSEKATRKIEEGDIAYWPLGDAICVFLDNVEPYSDVNRIGRITDGLALFSKARQGTKVTLDRD
ncbi:MAG: cyclophilin-like fold protein [Promethearchaeati archaeon SRVP18_Atabeyarchaeia-1]